MKTIVASWDRNRVTDAVRTKMGAMPLDYPTAFSSLDVPPELTQVYDTSGTNEEFFDKLGEQELMSTFRAFIDSFATQAMQVEFAWMDTLNDLSLAVFAGDQSLGGEFVVEQANFGQGLKSTLLFCAVRAEEFLDRILPLGSDSWKLMKTADEQFVLQADNDGSSDWFVIETLDRKARGEVEAMTAAESQQRAKELSVTSDRLAAAIADHYRLLLGGAS
jgi:hypothetical protein